MIRFHFRITHNVHPLFTMLFAFAFKWEGAGSHFLTLVASQAYHLLTYYSTHTLKQCKFQANNFQYAILIVIIHNIK